VTATAPVPVRPLASRLAVLLLWLVALAIAAAVIVRTPFTADLSAFLPADPDPRQRVLIEQLQSGVAARTLLIGITGGSAEERADASRALAAALRAGPHFEQVQNGELGVGGDGRATAGANPIGNEIGGEPGGHPDADLGHRGGAGGSDFEAIGEWLFTQRYALSPAVGPERFTVDGLIDAIDETLSLLGTPAGNAFRPLLDRDPTGEMQRIAEALIPANAPRSAGGVWVSRDQPRAVLLAGIRASGDDLDGQAAALLAVREAFDRLVHAVAAPAPAGSAPAPGSALQLQLSGAPLFAVDSRAQIEAEVKRLAMFGAVGVSALLLLAFASVPALAVALLPVATGVAVGIAAVALGFGEVHGVALGFGSALIGESVDYAIYYLVQARSGAAQGRGAGWRHWLHNSWPTVRMGLLTSLCGFSALVFSGFPGLQQLGVFALAGLLGAALATRFVLPTLMPDGTRGLGMRRALGRLALAAMQLLPALRWPLLALGLAAAAFLFIQRGTLWTADLAALSPIPAEAMALDESLRNDLAAGDGGALLVVQADDLQTTLERAEAAAAVLDALVDAGQLAGYSTVTRWLPSERTQRARRGALPETAALRAALAEATAGGPLPAARLEPFVEAVQAARAQPPITLQDLQAQPVRPVIDALLQRRDDGRWVALLPLEALDLLAGEADSAAEAAALEASLAGMEGLQVLAIAPELGRLYAHYLGEAQAQALLGATGVLLLLALWLRSPRRLLAVCQPLLLAVLLTLAGLALLQVPLGILHLVGLLLVVAVGSNYALFFDLLQQSPAGGHAAAAGGASAAGTTAAPPATDEAHAPGGPGRIGTPGAPGATAGPGPVPDLETLASLLLANLTTVAAFGLLASSAIPALSALGQVVAPGALLALLLAAAFARREGGVGAVGRHRGA
jgi:predicted exporter